MDKRAPIWGRVVTKLNMSRGPCAGVLGLGQSSVQAACRSHPVEELERRKEAACGRENRRSRWCTRRG